MITIILFYLLEQKLQLKCEFEKEFKELHRKYDIKLKAIEVEFQNSRKNLETQLKTVHVNKILADAFRSKSSNLKLPGLSGTLQGTFPSTYAADCSNCRNVYAIYYPLDRNVLPK